MRAAIGADLGGTKMAIGVVDSDQNLLHRGTEPTTGLELDALLDTLEHELRAAIDACPEAEAIGVGVPCTLDHTRGRAIASVNLPIVDVPIRDLLQRRLHLPVYLDNDANVAAIGEHRFGAAVGCDQVVMLTIGTGVGGGLILDGRLYRGKSGAAAELGHMVIQEDGPRCQGNCPNHGCLESLASGTALGRAGREAAEREPDSALGRALAAGDPISGRTVTEAALAGDDASIRVLASVGRHLGVGLASYANIFEPELIVIGGGVAAAGELLLGPAREQLRERALEPMDRTPVVLAELGPDAGMIGAAAMAFEEHQPAPAPEPA